MKKYGLYIGLALLAVGSYMYFKDEKKGSSSSADSFPLKYGSKGQLVSNLQKYLNHAGDYGLQVTGTFGAGTLDAVKAELSKDFVDQSYYDMFIAPFIKTGK